MLRFISFLFNNWKVKPIAIGFFSYWIKFSFKRHANSSFYHESTCLFLKNMQAILTILFINWYYKKETLISYLNKFLKVFVQHECLF